MTTNSGSEVDGYLLFAIRVLRRQAGKMALLFVLGMTVTVIATYVSPRVYRSEAKLYVRLGRENATLDPTATLGQNPVVALPPTRENELNSFLEILTSRTLIEQVIDRLLKENALPDVESSEGELSPQAKALLIRDMSRQLEVEVVKRSNILVVSYQGSSPEFAQQVVATLVDLYLEQHVRLHRTPGAVRFLTEQLNRVEKQLSKNEEKLRQLKEKTGLVAVDTQRQQLVSRIGRLEDELLQTQALQTAAESEIEGLRKRTREMPATQIIGQTSGLPNPALDTMRSQFYALQLRERELSNKFATNHPEVRAVRRQLEEAREVLDKEEKQREQVTTGPTKLSEDANLTLLRQETLVKGYEAKSKLLHAQIAEQRKALLALDEAEPLLSKLQREHEVLIAQDRKYRESLEQLQIDQALQSERISNITLFQPATFEPIPIKPKWLINLALGLAFSVGASLGLGGLLESRNRASGQIAS